jgi:hypothetical protein
MNVAAGAATRRCCHALRPVVRVVGGCIQRSTTRETRRSTMVAVSRCLLTTRLLLLVLLLSLRGLAFDLTGTRERSVNLTCRASRNGTRGSAIRPPFASNRREVAIQAECRSAGSSSRSTAACSAGGLSPHPVGQSRPPIVAAGVSSLVVEQLATLALEEVDRSLGRPASFCRGVLAAAAPPPSVRTDPCLSSSSELINENTGNRMWVHTRRQRSRSPAFGVSRARRDLVRAWYRPR